MTYVAETSLTAYFGEVVSKMGDRQRTVLEALAFNGAMTNTEIARKLNWSINTVTPRVFELRERGLVIERGKVRCSITGRAAILWGIASEKPIQRKLL